MSSLNQSAIPQQSAAKPLTSKLRRTIKTIAVVALSIGIMTPIAKAGPLDQLNDVLSNGVNGAINDAIGGILGGGDGPWNEKIPGAILGGKGGGFSLPDPFAALNRSFESLLKDILAGAIGGDSPWDEKIPTGGGTGGNTGEDGGLPIDKPVIDIGGGFDLSIDKPIIDLGGIGVKVGALGLPDITATHKALDQIAKGLNQSQAKALDRFNSNSVAFAYSTKAEADRVANKGVATTVIGTEGQKQMKEEAENASKVLDTIQALNTDAQKKDVTQDVMKALSAMSYGQASLTAGSYAELMGLRQQTAATSVVTANISEGIDEGNRRDHAERMGAAISVLNAAGSVYLPGK